MSVAYDNKSTGKVLSGDNRNAEQQPADYFGTDDLNEQSFSGFSENRLNQFLAEPDLGLALCYWLGSSYDCADSNSSSLLERLDRDICKLDDAIGKQVNAILHHPKFQELEASWRGLDYLTIQAWSAENVKIRVLSITWKAVARDFDRALEFDQSELFKKIYSEQFDMPGGEPYGLLIGDYQISHQLRPDNSINDIAVLRGISQVAAAAFAPFVAGVHPAMFGLDSFCELKAWFDFKPVFKQTEYLKWTAFRQIEDSRFIGLTLPRILLRLPYQDDGSRNDGFSFEEDVEDSQSNSRYLWGNACFAFAATVIQAYSNSGWLADIRGVQTDDNDGSLIAAGGLVQGLPVDSYATDREGLIPKSSTDISISGYQEKQLTEMGFIPLSHCKDSRWCVFYSNPSVQAPTQTYDSANANANARLSSALQYILSASRFAHYLKIIGREKLGTFAQPNELRKYLQDWLRKDYTTARDSASAAEKARRPLREARVEIEENPGKPGSYLCSVFLRPHYQLEQLSAFIKLETEITTAE